MNSAMRFSPTKALMRSSASAVSRTTVGFTFNGGRPIRAELADIGKFIKSSPKAIIGYLCNNDLGDGQMKRRRTLYRPRHIVIGDTRCPMLRLLQDNVTGNGQVEPDYEQQFRTMFKAQRLGYLDGDRRLTETGKAFVAKASECAA
jgi:hypothetical protein